MRTVPSRYNLVRSSEIASRNENNSDSKLRKPIMDASVLARTLENLEKSWSSLDWWLNFWTILVVVGVAVELGVLVTEYVHDWRDFKRGTIHSPEKPSLLIFVLGLLGAGLVAIGVAGEFQVHVKAGKIESDMRSRSRELVALANKDANAANERAKGFDAAIASSNLEAKKATDRAAQTETLALQYEAQIAKSNAQAEQARSIAEHERLERAKFESRFAWRAISSSQRSKLLELSKDPTRQLPRQVSFNFILGSPEAKRYGQVIAEVLNAAGISVDVPAGGTVGNASMNGVWVCRGSAATADTVTQAIALGRLLIDAGIADVIAACQDGEPGQKIEIIVGPKPDQPE